MNPAVCRLTGEIDILNVDLILIPVHSNVSSFQLMLLAISMGYHDRVGDNCFVTLNG